MTDHKKFGVDIVVRFKDIDAMGHVNNAVFFTYFEEGRKEFFSQILNVVKPEDYKKKYSFILANVSCDFLKPVKTNTPVSLQLWVSDLGRKTFHFKYRLVDRNDESIIHAKGKSTQVFFDYKNSVTATIPKSFVEKVSEYTEHGDND